MFDIDEFKRFNDKYGHDIGDFVLEQVGLRIVSFSNTKGIEAYRYGGEELTIIFSYTHPTYNIEEHVEEFRHSVSQIRIPNVDETVTISAGLAYYNMKNVKNSEESKQLLLDTCKKADMQLYEAKHSGKNKLCVSNLKA